MARRVPFFFTDTDTPLHRLDARAKLLVISFVVVFLFCAPPLSWLVAFAVVGLAIALVARFPLKWLGIIMLVQVPNLIGFVTIPLIAGAIGGDVGFSGNVELGVRLSLAWLGAIATITGLFSTMTIDQLTDGLRALPIPRVVSYGVGYAFRLLYTSLDDLFHIVDALKYKGVDTRTRNPVRLLRNLTTIVVPAITTVVRRSNTMMAVLRARGFSVSGTLRPTIALSGIGIGEVAFVAAGLVGVLLGLEHRFGLLPGLTL